VCNGGTDGVSRLGTLASPDGTKKDVTISDPRGPARAGLRARDSRATQGGRASSTGGVPPIRQGMPTLVAMLVASFAGWIVAGPAQAMLGLGASLLVSLVVSTVAYVVAKKFVSDLRDGS